MFPLWAAFAYAIALSESTFAAIAALIGIAMYALISDIAARSGSSSPASVLSSSFVSFLYCSPIGRLLSSSVDVRREDREGVPGHPQDAHLRAVGERIALLPLHLLVCELPLVVGGARDDRGGSPLGRIHCGCGMGLAARPAGSPTRSVAVHAV